MRLIGVAAYAGHTLRYFLDECPDNSASGFIELDASELTLDHWHEADGDPNAPERQLCLSEKRTFRFRICGIERASDGARVRGRVHGRVVTTEKLLQTSELGTEAEPITSPSRKSFAWACPRGHHLLLPDTAKELRDPRVGFFCWACGTGYAPGPLLRLAALHYVRTGEPPACEGLTCHQCGEMMDVLLTQRHGEGPTGRQIPCVSCGIQLHTSWSGDIIEVLSRPRPPRPQL